MSNQESYTSKSTNAKDRIGATKVPLSLIPLSAQIHTALAHFDGSLKYGAVNWRSESVAATIYVDAALRHILKWFDREKEDADSGIHHLGHAVACLNIIMDAEHVQNLVDDRPKTSLSSRALDDAREEVVRLIKLRGGDVPDTPPINKRKLEEESVLEKLDEYYGFSDAEARRRQLERQLEEERKAYMSRKASVIKTEAINGHTVEFSTDPESGFIDGKWYRGTDFISKVAFYRKGVENADELEEKER